MAVHNDFIDRKKIVVKFGTDSLEDKRLEKIADEISTMKHYGKKITIVSSGAIAFGRRNLNCQDNSIASKQIMSAVGQPFLMMGWNHYLNRRNLYGGQILVTYDDFSNDRRFSNLKSLYEGMCKADNIVPIFNENDALATDEIRFGDNDILASYVATELGNELLVIYSVNDGLIKDGRTVEIAHSFEAGDYDNLGKSKSGTGGIESKLIAARRCSERGIPCIIAGISSSLADVLTGIAKRTLFCLYNEAYHPAK